MDYKSKYCKYKNKYLNLKNQFAGSVSAGESKTNQNEPINLNLLKKVPVEIYDEMIKLRSCKAIINYMIKNKNTFQYFNKDDWYTLIDNIFIEDYQFNYTNLKYPDQPQHPYINLMDQTILCSNPEINIFCRLFTTKCLHKHLITKYENNDLKECWYEAIRRNNTDDYEYFNKLVDTTTIGGYAFEMGGYAFENNQLTQVTIPNSVTTIGEYAFAYNKLTEVTIPDSVTTIGENAFANNQLKKVDIPNSVTTIGKDAFKNNELTQVTIPDYVTTIDYGAFANNQLTQVTIGNSVTAIYWNAFKNNQLTQVTIPNYVTTIDYGAFDVNVNVEIIRNLNQVAGGTRHLKTMTGSSMNSINRNILISEEKGLEGTIEWANSNAEKYFDPPIEVMWNLIELATSMHFSLDGVEAIINFNLFHLRNSESEYNSKPLIILPGYSSDSLGMTLTRTSRMKNEIFSKGFSDIYIFDFTGIGGRKKDKPEEPGLDIQAAVTNINGMYEIISKHLSKYISENYKNFSILGRSAGGGLSLQLVFLHGLQPVSLNLAAPGYSYDDIKEHIIAYPNKDLQIRICWAKEDKKISEEDGQKLKELLKDYTDFMYYLVIVGSEDDKATHRIQPILLDNLI